ncbi:MULTISPECIES: hypothetical protein [unclassified Thiocapsa]|uniref:hypothetical protein n=1 Tax=unclassified Thiocapsa TaxID=2641286 RepID=UPI0035B483A9
MVRIGPVALGILAIELAAAAPAPGVLLYGATPEQARDFAIDSAYRRGWNVPVVGETTVEIEQILEESDPDDPLAPRRLIRISAVFVPEGAGTRVLLRAREVQTSATGEEWSTDVTERYAENLGNALSSLRSKWDGHRDTGSPRTREPARPAASIDESADGATEADAGPVGTWTYYAERYAESRGCVLTDAKTHLEASGPEWEQHRVNCRDGRAMHVHCRQGDCTTRR